MRWLKHFLSEDFTVTKRQLGIFLLVSGGIGFTIILLIDLFNAGREGGIGPAQLLALVMMLIIAVVGASLIPLGDKPA